MPRIQPRLFRQAARINPLLATLLPACRDLSSAQNELRWIRQHVEETRSDSLTRLCNRRGRGEPLQYVLGSQPFGTLDIKCRRDVLVPRAETEAYTYHLASLIRTGHKREDSLSVVDFCTGTGCIPLLLASLLQQARVCGVDISHKAVALSKENIRHNMAKGCLPRDRDISIVESDIFSDTLIDDLAQSRWDVMVSNPPYISQDIWNHGRGQLGYSVRKYEPRLALVPGLGRVIPDGWAHEDVFYARLLEIAAVLRPRFVLLEVGDEAQARRVLGHLLLREMGSVRVWRSWPDGQPEGEDAAQLSVESGERRWDVPVEGSGPVRAILITRLEET